MCRGRAKESKNRRYVRPLQQVTVTGALGLAVLGLAVASCSPARRAPESPPPATTAPPFGEPIGDPPPGGDAPVARPKVFPPEQAAPPARGDAGEWTGQVRAGLMAIGGETTGISLTTGADLFELRASGALLDALRAADGRQVTVRGVRRDVESVETGRTRRLIEVTAIVTP